MNIRRESLNEVPEDLVRAPNIQLDAFKLELARQMAGPEPDDLGKRAAWLDRFKHAKKIIVSTPGIPSELYGLTDQELEAAKIGNANVENWMTIRVSRLD